MTTTTAPIRIQLAVKATPEQVWQALTDGAITPAYYMGFSAEFDLTPGAPYRYTAGGGADPAIRHFLQARHGTTP